MSWDAILLDLAGRLDRPRRTLLQQGVRVPALKRLLAQPEQRLSLIASAHAALAFALATYVPVLLLLIGPVLLGAAHVAADVRYLVLRRGLSRSWRRIILAFCVVLIAARAWTLVSGASFGRAEHLLFVLWGALGIHAGAARRPGAFRPAVAAALLALTGAAALLWPRQSDLLLVHAHNWVGIAAWLLLLRPRIGHLWLPAALVIGGSALLGSGALYRHALSSGADVLGLHVLQAAEWMAPGFDLQRALGLTCAYVFLQSVHYATWLVYIPRALSSRRAPNTFSGSAAALVGDFGSAGTALVLATVAGVLLAGCFDLQQARVVYLALANFHVYLELVLLAYLWVAGELPVAARPLTPPAGTWP
jgi:hypothetical protein